MSKLFYYLAFNQMKSDCKAQLPNCPTSRRFGRSALTAAHTSTSVPSPTLSTTPPSRLLGSGSRECGRESSHLWLSNFAAVKETRLSLVTLKSVTLTVNTAPIVEMRLRTRWRVNVTCNLNAQ